MNESREHLRSIALRLCGAGIVLSVLLPIGFWSTTSLLYSFFWILHFGVLLSALYVSMRVLCRGLLADGVLGRVGICLLVLVSFSVVMLSLTPILARDALIYHLEVPRQWIAAGRIIELPWNEWSYFPMLLSLGYSGFLRLGLEQYTPLYHAAYFFISVAILAELAHFLSPAARVRSFTAILALTIPLFIKLAASPMSDLGLLAFFSATLALLVTESSELNIKWFCAAGVALGLCFACKYNSFLAGVVLCLLLSVYLQRLGYGTREILLSLVAVVCSAALVLLPWLIKNALWTGNPVYPFLQNLFASDRGSAAFMGNVSALEYRQEAFGENIFEVFLTPLRMLFLGEDDNPARYDGVLSPVLLLSVAGIWHRPSRRTLTFLGSFAAVYVVFSLFLFHALVRYLVPAIAVVILLSGLSVEVLPSDRAKWKTTLCWSVVMFQILWAGSYGAALIEKNDVVPYLRRALSKDEYLSRHLSDYNAINFINHHLAPDARVYLLFSGSRYFYLQRAAQGGYFSGDCVLNIVRESGDGNEIARRFRQAGFSHLLLHRRRTSEVFSLALSPEEDQRWESFLREHLRQVYSDPFYTLAEIQESAERE